MDEIFEGMPVRRTCRAYARRQETTMLFVRWSTTTGRRVRHDYVQMDDPVRRERQRRRE